MDRIPGKGNFLHEYADGALILFVNVTNLLLQSLFLFFISRSRENSQEAFTVSSGNLRLSCGKNQQILTFDNFWFFLINTRAICLNSCGTRATDYTSEETSSFDLFTADFFIPLLFACSMKHLCFGNHSVVRC